MALTRNYLKSMGLTDEQVNAIIENHAETVEALKKERDGYKATAETVEQITKERDEVREKLDKAGDAAKVQKEFDDYKAGIEAEKLTAQKRTAYEALLKDAGMARESARSLVLKTVDYAKIELDNDGKIKDADRHKDSIKADYADFIGKVETAGTNTANPPSGGGGGTKTKEQILAIKDGAERRRAMAENPALFGLDAQ